MSVFSFLTALFVKMDKSKDGRLEWICYWNDTHAIFFLTFFIKAYVVGTLWIASTCWGNSDEYQQRVFIKKYKEVHWCNLKTTKLLDCALIGAYAVIRLNMGFLLGKFFSVYMCGFTFCKTIWVLCIMGQKCNKFVYYYDKQSLWSLWSVRYICQPKHLFV